MSREPATAKAKRLLGEGRVMVLEARGRFIRAYVRGDSGAHYEVIHDRGAWACPCACIGECSHVKALQLCTAPVRLHKNNDQETTHHD
jgi:uncharacterized Zn finger protein